MIKAKTRRALDSMILDDAVARQDTVTQLIACVRRVAHVVSGGPGLVAGVCTGHDYAAAGKPDMAWDDPGSRDQLVSALVDDTVALLAAIEADLAPEHLGRSVGEAVALLALVAGQDVDPPRDPTAATGAGASRARSPLTG